jgi:nicotinamidase-related amidase
MASALLVIDVQQALFEPHPRPGAAPEVLARINALSARARAAGVPVVFIQHEDAEMIRDTPGWALAQELDVRDGDIRVRKSTPDSFHRTGLADMLGEHGIDHVVVCGYATEFCVDTTVRRAASLGYGVTLAADGHTTHDKPHADADRIRTHHNATLPAISSFGPRIVARPCGDISFASAAGAIHAH